MPVTVANSWGLNQRVKSFKGPIMLADMPSPNSARPTRARVKSLAWAKIKAPTDPTIFRTTMVRLDPTLSRTGPRGSWLTAKA